MPSRLKQYALITLFLLGFLSLWASTFYLLSVYYRGEYVACCERDGTTYRRGLPYWSSYTTNHGEQEVTGWLSPTVAGGYRQNIDRRSQGFAILVAALPSLLIACLIGFRRLGNQGPGHLRAPLRAAGFAALAVLLLAGTLRLTIGANWLMEYPYIHDSAMGEIVTVLALTMWAFAGAVFAAVFGLPFMRYLHTRNPRSTDPDGDWPDDSPSAWDEAKLPPSPAQPPPHEK